MRAALASLLLAAAVPSQPIPPWNLEVHPEVAIAQVVTWQYRPALVLMWQPRRAKPTFTLHPTGKQLTLVLREIGILHPVGWTGQCPTRLMAGLWWPGPLHVWRGSANPYIEFSYGNRAPSLFNPASHWFEYGNFFGSWPNCLVGGSTASAPEWVGALFELQGL